MRARPSYRVRFPSSKSVAATNVTIARNTASRRTISREVLIGRTSALAPMTKAIVTTVEASALPSAISGLPSSAAMPLTRSSGTAESVETRRAPTTKRLRPIFPEIRVALSVMNFAPWLSVIKPIAIATAQGTHSSIPRIPFGRTRDSSATHQASFPAAGVDKGHPSGARLYYEVTRRAAHVHPNKHDRCDPGSRVRGPDGPRPSPAMDAVDSEDRPAHVGAVRDRYELAGDSGRRETDARVHGPRDGAGASDPARTRGGQQADEGPPGVPPHAERRRDGNPVRGRDAGQRALPPDERRDEPDDGGDRRRFA